MWTFEVTDSTTNSRTCTLLVYSSMLAGSTASCALFWWLIPLLESLVFLLIVFGAMNVASLWAAIGSGSFLKRQAAMSVFACISWGSLAIGDIFGLPFSQFGDVLPDIAVFAAALFLVAQLPFWFLRRCGIRLGNNNAVGKGLPTVSFRLRDLFFVMVLAALTLALIRVVAIIWQEGESNQIGFRVLRVSAATTGAALLVCMLFTAPVMVMATFRERFLRVLLVAFVNFACSWVLGVFVVWAMHTAKPNVPMSIGTMLFLGIQTMVLFTTIWLPLIMLRGAGVRIWCDSR
jgi:hypothetical protein